MSLKLRWARGADWREIDEYVGGHPQACFGHTEMWRRAIWQAYRLPTVALTARRGGALVGVAPWTLMFSPLAGPYLVIAPFASHADLLVDHPVVADALLAETVADARWIGAAYAQVRSLHAPLALRALRGKVDGDRFITSVVDISEGAEVAWWRAIHGKTRNQLRKARRLSLRVVEDPDGSPFAKVCAAGSQALGSPFHQRPFFSALERCFGQRLHTWVAFTAAGEPAAAALTIDHGGVRHYVYGHNVRRLRHTCANSLVVWTLLERACERGLQQLDLGRSERGQPAERFKRKWGADHRPITETVALIWRRRAPNLNPTNPSLARAQRLWRRLPEAISRRLGPLLMRGIG